jgi:hypothetical protein
MDSLITRQRCKPLYPEALHNYGNKLHHSHIA